MQKNLKNVLSLCVILLSILLLNTFKAKATFKSKLSNAINLAFGIKPRDVHYLTKNLKGDATLLQQVRELADGKFTSGREMLDIMEKKIPSVVEERFFYYQTRGENGTETLISRSVPKVVGVDGKEVLTQYRNAAGFKEILKTEGAPFWINGKEVKEGTKIRLENKMEKYFDSMKNVDLEYYYDNLENPISLNLSENNLTQLGSVLNIEKSTSNIISSTDSDKGATGISRSFFGAQYKKLEESDSE